MTLISIVIPVYNEEEVIKLILDKVRKIKREVSEYDFEIIVVDDSSQDSTFEILKQENDIILINNPYNLGYGASLKRGIRRAQGEWVCIVDADGTYPIDKISDFLPYLNSYDMVVGARITNNNHTPLVRRPAKKFLNWFAGWIVNFQIPDLNSGMRIFRRDFCLEFWGLYPDKFSFTSTITLAFIRSNYFIKYIPIDYYKRVGKSSISPWHFLTFMGLVFRIAFYFKPLKFLTFFASLFFIGGFIKGAYDFYHVNYVGNLSVMLIIVSFIILAGGFMADLFFKQKSLWVSKI